MKLPDELRNDESSTASLGSDSVKPEIESSATRQISPLNRHFPDSVPGATAAENERLCTNPQVYRTPW